MEQFEHLRLLLRRVFRWVLLWQTAYVFQWVVLAVWGASPWLLGLFHNKSYTPMEMISDREAGCLWGAVLGDVIGAYVENDKAVTKEKVQKAFTICGGGIRHLEPGQPTDDSQLTMAVAKGLVAGKGVLNLNLIAQEMANWFLSKPIDVGNTIRNSVPKACNMKEHQAHLVRKGANQRSQTSQSNGTLMSIAGVAVWCKNLHLQDIELAVREFTILIHPNEVVALANTAYVIAATYLMNHAGEEKRNVMAFEEAEKWLISKGNKDLIGWMDTIKGTVGSIDELLKQVPPNKAEGWIKIAFTYAMHFLLAGALFQKAIEKIINVKGDTDTNACIVGALLGAYHGLNGLDMQVQIDKICQYKGRVFKRPQWLIPGKVVPNLITRLKEIAPKELKMVGNSNNDK